MSFHDLPPAVTPEGCDGLEMSAQKEASSIAPMQHANMPSLEAIADEGLAGSNLLAQFKSVLCYHPCDWRGLQIAKHGTNSSLHPEAKRELVTRTAL